MSTAVHSGRVCCNTGSFAKPFTGSRAALVRHCSTASPAQRGCLQVNNALTRKEKEATVERLVDGLEGSAVVFGMRFKGISVKKWQAFKDSLPEETKVIVCKNNLMKVAADKVEGWSDLKEACQGENAWVFVHEEAISESVKAYLAFEKSLLDALPKEERAKAKPTDVSGGAMDGKYLTSAQLRSLEKMPTKLELYGKIAFLIRQVPTKVAIGIKQVPTKLAIGVKKLGEGDDDTTKTVGDIFPKPSEA